MGNQEHIELETRLYIHPKQSRYFDVYEEVPIPYQYQESCAKIELCEVIALGYDYVMVPLQVYKTGDSSLYKLIALIDYVKCDTPCIPLVEINARNIRIYQMTKDGQVFMPKFEHIDKTDLDWELNKQVEYQLIDITAKANYVRSCGLAMNHYVSDRKKLPQEERLKLYWDETDISYISQRFGFRERDIILLPKKENDSLETIRFQVLQVNYCINNGKLVIEHVEDV